MMYFQCDYAQGCHPLLLERLIAANLASHPGYGLDDCCDSARYRIREACRQPCADVHFLSGGTQTNLIAISACLKSYQGVLTADIGHIACHETGAIEATGHKVLSLSSPDGILSAQQVREACCAHYSSPTREHTVQPGMVYISLPTECGTLYTRAQLEALHSCCRELGLLLYIDGARLGYGLTSPANDLTLADIASLCDLFYIGGTKCGALLGEALVIVNDALKADFRYTIKQRGGMLAKGWLLGLAFDALFTDGLYFDICRQANEYALSIRSALEQKGIPLGYDSHTNQQFPILTARQLARLQPKYVWEPWQVFPDGRQMVRFCTSWATTQQQAESLINDILQL
jgi:threonine aldolase